MLKMATCLKGSYIIILNQLRCCNHPLKELEYRSETFFNCHYILLWSNSASPSHYCSIYMIPASREMPSSSKSDTRETSKPQLFQGVAELKTS